MSKTRLRQQIDKLLTRGVGPEVVLYYEGSYKIGEAGKLTEITDKQAIMYLRAGAHLIHIVEDVRKWDWDLNVFVGPEPVHETLPDVPEGTEVMRLTCAYPATEAAHEFSRLL